MRILLIASHLNVGGITTYLLALCRQYRLQGHEVYLASQGGARQNEFIELGVRLEIVPLKVKAELHPQVMIQIPRLCRLIAKDKIQIIHAHTRVTQVLGQVLSSWTGIPYVSTCHGFYKLRFFRRVFPLWGQKVVAISPAVCDHLIKDFKVPPENIHLIPNGIDVDFFSPVDAIQKERLREKFKIEGSPVIGIIARLADVKGHAVLIQAMPRILQEFPNTILFIAGKGNMESQLKKQTADLGISQNVIFASVYNQSSQIHGILDVLAMPSTDEGFGLSAMEAQASGLPVVASNIGGIPSFIENEKTGLLVPPKDPGQLAQAILRFLKDPQWARSLGLAARKIIIERFSSEMTAQKTLLMYREVIKSENV